MGRTCSGVVLLHTAVDSRVEVGVAVESVDPSENYEHTPIFNVFKRRCSLSDYCRLSRWLKGNRTNRQIADEEELFLHSSSLVFSPSFPMTKFIFLVAAMFY